MTFETLPNGDEITRHILRNDDLEVAILSYGAILQSVRYQGGPNMTLGYPKAENYIAEATYAGCIIGPVANRIAGAKAKLDNNTYYLDANEGANCLHSGKDGFHAQNWQVGDVSDTHILLTLAVGDEDGGFPGNRVVALRYELVGASLWLTMLGTSDEATWMNLTHHGYWNLDGTRTFKGHKLWVDGVDWVGVDDANIPTDIQMCPYDFAKGMDLPADESGEIDHNLCLAPSDKDIRTVARLTAPSGRTMEIATSEVGLQIYDGRSLPTPYSHIALETQGYPDAPNRDDFPSVRLEGGETYGHVTEYRFS
jgi:aldose 1-epimerase